MEKRYWFVVLSYYTATQEGNANFGYISDEQNPFNNDGVKKSWLEKNKEFQMKNIVIINFIEFKNEEDFNNFFKS